MTAIILGKNLVFRLVEVEDAKFIIDLRRSRGGLSPISSRVEDQVKWILDYKKREKQKLEYYFIIELKNKERLGVLRLYDFEDDSFSWGSWVISEDSPKKSALESALLVYEFAFFKLKFSKSHFVVRKDNKKVVNFHKKFGAKIVDEDEENYFFNIELSDYLATKNRLNQFGLLNDKKDN